MLGLLKNDKMGKYELENKRASYRTIVETFIGDILLCNNICEVDSSVYDNMILENNTKYYNENGEEITEDEYYADDNAYCDNSTPDIYQYYLCDVHCKEELEKYGLLFSYSDMLNLDVLCVDHFGTSWDYVLTDCPIFETWEELEEYNNNLESE